MIDSLDVKDRKILSELDLNAKKSVTEIAKKVRLNKNTVNFRINRLVKEGFILGFYPVIDISRLGYFSVRVYFNFFSASPKEEQDILEYLKNQRNVGVVAELETTYDMMISVIVKDIYEFEIFWMSFKEKFRPFFSDEKISIFTKVIHLKRKYLSEKPNHDEEIIGGNKKENFDDIDFKILSTLSIDCRMPALEISNLLKIPARTVLYRIKQMEKKKIIQGYRINLNLEKIGYEYYKINFQFNNMKSEAIETFCKTNLNVIFIDYTLSDYDFEIDAEVENKQELGRLIKEIKAKYGVRHAEIITFKKYHKLKSMPEI